MKYLIVLLTMLASPITQSGVLVDPSLEFELGYEVESDAEKTAQEESKNVDKEDLKGITFLVGPGFKIADLAKTSIKLGAIKYTNLDENSEIDDCFDEDCNPVLKILFEGELGLEGERFGASALYRYGGLTGPGIKLTALPLDIFGPFKLFVTLKYFKLEDYDTKAKTNNYGATINLMF